jgi:hypothetical protein
MVYNNSVERSPFEGNSRSTTNDFPKISWNPKFHCRVHKSLPPIPILSRMNPIYTTLSHVSNIHFNISIPPTSTST